MTECLHFHFSLSCTGEGNGNQPQCSCLENPRDSRAWWAAVYGVEQSQTRLKRLSRSSSSSRVLSVLILLLIVFVTLDYILLCFIWGFFATLWTVAYQAPPSVGFSRQEYCSGLPFPSPGDLPDPGIEPGSPALQADTLTSELPGKPLFFIWV